MILLDTVPPADVGHPVTVGLFHLGAFGGVFVVGFGTVDDVGGFGFAFWVGGLRFGFDGRGGGGGEGRVGGSGFWWFEVGTDVAVVGGAEVEEGQEVVGTIDGCEVRGACSKSFRSALRSSLCAIERCTLRNVREHPRMLGTCYRPRSVDLFPLTAPAPARSLPIRPGRRRSLHDVGDSTGSSIVP